MTRTEINFCTKDTTFGSGRVLLDDSYPNGITLDAFPEGGDDPVLMNVPADKAHEIADWIKANVPVPTPVHPDWASIPVGSDFGFYRSEEAAAKPVARFPYTKTSEDTYTHHGPFADEKRPTPPPPNSDRLIARPADPLAGARAAWGGMEVGDTFRFTDNQPIRVHIKVSATEYRHDMNYMSDASGPRYGNRTTGIEDFLGYGIIPNPKPTVREQVNALPDGTLFHVEGRYVPIGGYIKLTEDTVYARNARAVWDIKDPEYHVEGWKNTKGIVVTDEA